MRILKTLTVLSAISLLMICSPAEIWGRSRTRSIVGVSAGGVFSVRQSGLDVSLHLDDGSFRDFAIYVDYSDILDRNRITPGFRFSYYHNLPICSNDWDGFPFLVYAGPGAVLGYMHERNQTEYGVIAGISGCAGIRFKMWHNVSIGVENQLDLSMRFSSDSNVSFLMSGCIFSYIPMIKVHYEF